MGNKCRPVSPPVHLTQAALLQTALFLRGCCCSPVLLPKVDPESINCSEIHTAAPATQARLAHVPHRCCNRCMVD